jgi:ABC-type Na+ transport system ATPase subunit NatA
MPDMALRLATEREDELIMMMRISGLQSRTYFLSNYVFDVACASLWMLTLVVVGFSFGTVSFTSASFPSWMLLCVLWAHSQVCVASAIAALVPRRVPATIVAYFVVLLTAVLCSFLNQFMTTASSWPVALYLVPPVGFARAVGLVVTYAGFYPGGAADFAVPVLLMSAGAAMLFLVAVYTKADDGDTWFAACGAGRLLGRAVDVSSNEMAKPLLDDEQGSEGGAHMGDAVDVDVARERERVLRGDFMRPPAVTFTHLSKTYAASGARKEPTKALSDLCLAVDYGECFGLLGPNGAGKTTALSVLAGTLSQSDGTVSVCGFDVTAERNEVYTVLGVCPQHDRLWPDMTVQDHLVFYARLKGVLPSIERACVQQLSETVGLDGDTLSKSVSTLSGGMRRRLSVAISLVGNPRVWLLDEPTTGLSVEARREIYTIVHQQKEAWSMHRAHHALDGGG